MSTTARTMPSLTTCSLHRIGLALQRLAVKTVAESCWGPLLTTSATSLPPLVFRPASTPAAVKPAGWVTLTSCSPECVVSTDRSLRSLLDQLYGDGGGDVVTSSSPLLGGPVGVVDRDQDPVGVEGG